MSRHYQAIARANEQGRLGLMLYAIPGFPSREAYQEILQELNAREEVSVMETTLPVDADFSRLANATIQEAHRLASESTRGLSLGALMDGVEKPTICVLYQQTHERHGIKTLLEAAEGRLDGLLFEWSYGGTPEERALLLEHGVELITVVHASDEGERLQRTLDEAQHEPLIYFVTAAMTGATLFEPDMLQRSLERMRALRPDVKAVAGFGVGTAEDVRALSALEGLDGVIIGTAFLKACAQGPGAVRAFLDEICPALYWDRA